MKQKPKQPDSALKTKETSEGNPENLKTEGKKEEKKNKYEEEVIAAVKRAQEYREARAEIIGNEDDTEENESKGPEYQKGPAKMKGQLKGSNQFDPDFIRCDQNTEIDPLFLQLHYGQNAQFNH